MTTNHLTSLGLVAALLVLLLEVGTCAATASGAAAVKDEDDRRFGEGTKTAANDQFTLTESLLMNLLTTQRQILHKVTSVASDTKNITRVQMDYLVKTITQLEWELQNERNKLQEFKDQVYHLQHQVNNLQNQLAFNLNFSEPVTSTTKRPQPIIINDSECDPYYEAVGDSCLRFVLTDAKTWHDARRQCQLDGGDLAAKYDPDLVTLRLRGEPVQNIIVGASNLYANGHWWWLKTGAAVKPEYFAPGRPGGEACGALSRQFNYRMVDVNCATKLPYICQVIQDNLWVRE
ncbi:C-type lectin domain family 12 member B-like [Macrobrachium rosenbergii]|uniref:C-type lectin domain family 12 member B-like n=1 Tax=Macrobrachium rosenbergii TaxID=79674 RepID=UPI0034D5EEE8